MRALIHFINKAEPNSGSAPVVNPENKFMELSFVAREVSTRLTTPPQVIGARKIDLSVLPAGTRTIKFQATVSSSGATPSATVELWDITHNVIVSSVTNSSGVTDKTLSSTLISSALTEGTSSGNVRSDVACEYEVRLYRTSGIASDFVSCSNASVQIVYS